MGKVLKKEDQMILAERIIDIFETYLEQYKCTIPNPERFERFKEDGEETSQIYGTDYFNMERDIIEKLKGFGLISKNSESLL